MRQPHMLRILSLDGGGVRGLSSLIILREIILAIQQMPQSVSPLRPCDVFELIVGTGTGGISAILLGRMCLTVDQAIHEYIRIANTAFRPPSMLPQLNPFHTTFDNNAISRLLRDVVDAHLKDPDALFFDPCASQRCYTAVLSATSASLDAPPYIFRTYSSNPQVKIADVARATSATAGIFPPVSLTYPPMQFIDASTAGYTNPTEVALDESRTLWPSKNVDLVLSIGTGNQRIVDASQDKLAELSLRIMSSCEAVHDRVSRLLPPSTYFRFSVPQGLEDIGGTAWADKGLPGRVAEITSAYLRKAQPSRDLSFCAQTILGVKASLGIRGNTPLSFVPVTIDQSSQSDSEFKTYTREDIRIMQTVLRWTTHPSKNKGNDAVVITLCRGERQADGQTVLIKKYEGTRSDTIRRQFEKDRAIYQKIWDPQLLQFIGGSKATSSIPFHVYQSSLGEHTDYFWNWAGRTITSNPVEMIMGLYDMRISVKNLRAFERNHSVHFYSGALLGSAVCARHDGDRLRFSLVYVEELEECGDIFDETSNDNDVAYAELNDTVFFSSTDPREDNPSTALAMAFCDGIKAWFNNDVHDPLQGLLGSPFEAIDVHELGVALFERGCLGRSHAHLWYGGRNVGLGDVGYVNPNGRFEVVMNLHASLVSVNGGGSRRPRWQAGMVSAEGRVVEEVDVLECSGKLYRRYALPHAADFCLTEFELGYEDLDVRHAWKVFQRESARLVDVKSLSIEPHRLRLVTYVNKEWTKMRSTAVGVSASGKALGLGPSNGGGLAISDTVVYRFEEGMGVRVRDSGEPELDMRVYYSFCSTPDNLTVDSAGEDRAEWTEAKGDYQFRCEARQWIYYLQLPPGVACIDV